MFKTFSCLRFLSEPHILTKEKFHGATADPIWILRDALGKLQCEECAVGFLHSNGWFGRIHVPLKRRSQGFRVISVCHFYGNRGYVQVIIMREM